MFLPKLLKFIYIYNIVYVLFKQNNLLKDKLRTQLKVMFQSFTKQNCSAPIYSGDGSQKSLNSSTNSSWLETSIIVAASPEGCWPMLATPRAGGRKGVVPRRLNTSSQLTERNHSWDLMSSAPRRRLPNRLVTSVCRRQEMISFSTGEKKAGIKYLGSDRG